MENTSVKETENMQRDEKSFPKVAVSDNFNKNFVICGRMTVAFQKDF